MQKASCNMSEQSEKTGNARTWHLFDVASTVSNCFRHTRMLFSSTIRQIPTSNESHLTMILAVSICHNTGFHQFHHQFWCLHHCWQPEETTEWPIWQLWHVRVTSFLQFSIVFDMSGSMFPPIHSWTGHNWQTFDDNFSCFDVTEHQFPSLSTTFRWFYDGDSWWEHRQTVRFVM